MSSLNVLDSEQTTHSDRVDTSEEVEVCVGLMITWACLVTFWRQNTSPNTSLGSIHSVPSRPHTRSQAGILLKRRTPDEAHFCAEPKKQTTMARRRKSRKAATDEQSDTQTQSSLSSSSPKLSIITRHPSLASVSTTSRDQPDAPQTISWDASPTSDDHHESEPRLPRSRATLPTPVPNLTKKSRGRRVPTKESSRTTTDQKETRLYMCPVEGCGKCFHRGEHLKRHIRSIHTHEKRELSPNDFLPSAHFISSLQMHSLRKVF